MIGAFLLDQEVGSHKFGIIVGDCLYEIGGNALFRGGDSSLLTSGRAVDSWADVVDFVISVI